MTRIFLRLWVFVVIPLGLIWGVEEINPIGWWRQNLLRDAFVAQYSGTFHLLIDELGSRPAAEWADHVAQLQAHFGRRLALNDLQAEDYDADALETLEAGEFHFREAQPSILAYRVADSEKVLELALGETLEEDLMRSARGTVHIIERQLRNLTEEERVRYFDDVQAHFDVPVALLRWEDLDLPRDDLERLREESFLVPRQRDVFYQTLLDGDLVARVEIVTEIGAGLLIIVAFGVLAVSLGLGIVLWLFPFWRDMSHINRVAADFGTGILSARVSLRKNSAIRDLGNAFNAMADNIQRMIDGHRELTNSVSHDLRTPISRLRFALEMLETEADEKTRARYTRNIEKGVQSLEDLIDHLLVHARLDRTPSRDSFEPYDLDSLIQEEVELASSETGDVELVYEADPALRERRLLIDKIAMSRGLGNLLDNAVRYARKRIVIGFSCTDEMYEISVDDDGVGIEPADRERVFRPFTRLDDSQQINPGGHGLGLAIVKQVARWHGGDVVVERSELGGARFVITLPLRTP